MWIPLKIIKQLTKIKDNRHTNLIKHENIICVYFWNLWKKIKANDHFFKFLHLFHLSLKDNTKNK